MIEIIIALNFEFENELKFYNLVARNQYNEVPHLTQDTTWESDKITIRHHKQAVSTMYKLT